ncbi:hypothetical protein Zmor_021497 [Zophobas morio]|uniref:Uncharacterized protein n=1 Tax=Zophobas morio TaxID=2755281 RepID=A0AA38I6G8_9CUCU|nr:hypothetical protein Zmor_021497 [Zophobas morio]
MLKALVWMRPSFGAGRSRGEIGSNMSLESRLELVSFALPPPHAPRTRARCVLAHRPDLELRHLSPRTSFYGDGSRAGWKLLEVTSDRCRSEFGDPYADRLRR